MMNRLETEEAQMALIDYQEGSISLGRLAEILGLDPVSARNYIRAHGIVTACPEMDEILEDADNA
jgi:predicted HTH domain antitoxin